MASSNLLGQRRRRQLLRPQESASCSRLTPLTLLPLALILTAAGGVAALMHHPAGWHTSADVARVRSLIASGREPWQAAYRMLMNDTSLSKSYTPTPIPLVCRTCCGVSCCAPGTSCPGASSAGLEKDAMASYYLMMRWVATNDTEWATAAERIIDAWSENLVGFSGHDQMLAAGLYGGHMAQAAELLAFAKPGWPAKERAQHMFLEVVHPVCSLFCGRTNDGWPQPPPQTCEHCANGNWDAVCMSGIASWAVFLNNSTMLDTVAEYFKNGQGNGRLTNYIIDESGECQESGRDQGHTQLGLFNLVEAAFTIYHATGSTDMFIMENARLLAGLEYTAKFNLNYSVPYVSNCGPPGLPKPKGAGWCFKDGPSQQGRGVFSPMWELAGAIYGPIATPYINQLLHRPGYRPERGRGGPIIHEGPHVGDGAPRFGTLFHYGMPQVV